MTELPVIQNNAIQNNADRPLDARGCGSVRPSQRAKWRALALILVHVAIALHVVHFYVTGSTLTPVEPSEAMQTLGKQGLINAGFVVFIAAILVTLVFGRIFCGWGCHIVALQDLCTWILRKLRIPPKPLRSRLLVYIPLLAFIWMFIAPTVVRWYVGVSQDPLTTHFVTDDFWERFPEWPVATLTFLVCGFLIVYVLGDKGFCAYGCPYGGIFGVVDKVAPGKIRVTDACEGGGHCTATCTSNVRVHEEVKLYQMVVDPGCMKCLDCINVCPKDALYFGFGKPTVASGKPRVEKRPRRYDYSWPEEIALAVLFSNSVVFFRALYYRVRFLLSLGLASISAFSILAAWHVLRERNFSFVRFQLRRAGKLTRAGRVFLVLIAVWVVFIGHSGTVKYLVFSAERALAAGEQASQRFQGKLPPAEWHAYTEALQRLKLGDRLCRFPMTRVNGRIARTAHGMQDFETAERYYWDAVEAEPRFVPGAIQLAEYARKREDWNEASRWLALIAEQQPDSTEALQNYGLTLARAGKSDEALKVLRRASYPKSDRQNRTADLLPHSPLAVVRGPQKLILLEEGLRQWHVRELVNRAVDMNLTTAQDKHAVAWQ